MRGHYILSDKERNRKSKNNTNNCQKNHLSTPFLIFDGVSLPSIVSNKPGTTLLLFPR